MTRTFLVKIETGDDVVDENQIAIDMQDDLVDAGYSLVSVTPWRRHRDSVSPDSVSNLPSQNPAEMP